jgi:putative chitinase
VDRVILDRAAVQALTGDADRWLDALNNACIRWDITTPARVTMFLAQCGHESGGFRSLVENLNYSVAGLRETWPTRFSTTDALAMARQPERIAERAYGGRMGNGPEGSGDGYRYRGRGIIQLTGRENYQRAGEAIGLDFVAEPNLVEKPDWAAATAGWFWATHGCNALADAGDFLAITKRINGGTNGLADRQAWFAKVQSVIAHPPEPAQRTASERRQTPCR